MYFQQRTAASSAPEAIKRAPAPTPAMIELLSRHLLERARIAVIFGGNKGLDGSVLKQRGNPRSWKSYEAVARDIAGSLKRLGAAHVEVIADDMRLPGKLKSSSIDLAWLNTGGVQGYSSISHAPAMLEMLGIPYIGHDPLTAAMLDNKFTFKRQLHAMGLPTAPFVVWREAGADPARSPHLRSTFEQQTSGFIVKPISGRASLHVHFVESLGGLANATRQVIEATQSPVLIETYLPGREYCIAVCGPVIARNNRIQRLAAPFTFAAIERMLDRSERIFTSMDTRPITGDRIRSLDPVVDAVEIDTLEELASRLFLEMPLQTLVRLDVRADANGKLFILEANPKPDLKAAEGTTTSLIGAALSRYGMSYDDLIFAIFANRAADLLENASSITDAVEQIVGR